MSQTAFDLINEKYKTDLPPLKVLDDQDQVDQVLQDPAPSDQDQAPAVLNQIQADQTGHNQNLFDPAAALDHDHDQTQADPAPNTMALDPAAAQDQDKIQDQSRSTRPPLMHWRDSWPVELLSSFLKEFNDQGIFLKQTKEGRPVLCFNPGLKLEEKDPERFSMALHASYLMDKARADLQELIDNDALHLQIDKGFWL
jgi:hypothetical protein